MNFKISKKVFYSSLQTVSRAISSNSPIPSLTGIKIDVLEDSIVLTGSDSDISIQKILTANDEDINLVISETGSIVIVKQTKEVKENDIVFFLTDDHVPVIHRYIATTDQGELITKGDANPMEDSDPVSLDQVFGKVIKVF